MKLQDILILSEAELSLIESEAVFGELKKIVDGGVKTGLDKVTRGLHDYATHQLHRVDRGSPSYAILQKILSNPSNIAKQLVKSAITKKEPASSKDIDIVLSEI
jgi:hypothetical protein